MVKKIKIYKNFKINKIHKKSVILVGNFDGLHSGHQKLFKEAQKYKKKFKLKVGVVTFDPMPKMFFNKKIKNYRISSVDQKVGYFKRLEVDFLINKTFNKQFSKITCHKFIKEILSKELKAKYIFVSNNFRFGYRREGDVKLLKYYQSICDYKLINPKPLKKNKKIISSTYIRKLLEQGNLDKANKILTRRWTIDGKVEKGRMMGKKIGFPTCNIDIGNYVIAKPGVYAVKAIINKTNKIYRGIANLGYRPTFNQKKILLEVNLFNFSGNLYNKKLSVEFLKFIRGEKKFIGIDELRSQVKKDIFIAKKIK
jgi:riboflavin kinase/FMN adenylyltransferase